MDSEWKDEDAKEHSVNAIRPVNGSSAKHPESSPKALAPDRYGSE